MDYFPVFIDLKNKPCLVVGGGAVAERKVRLLLKAGAKVQIIAPSLSEKIQSWQEEGLVETSKKDFSSADLKRPRLVFAATNNAEVNQAVYEEAVAKGLTVNVADNPMQCQFIMPAIIDRGSVVIAASTSGQSPTLARHLRRQLEQVIPEKLGLLATWLGSQREKIKLRIKNEQKRRQFWDDLLQSPAVEQVLSGSQKKADVLLSEMLSSSEETRVGEVYLVGAGPGDPELLTLKAIRLMQQADVVLYDRLVSESILDKVRRDAERIYVGKKRAFHAVRQENINSLIVSHAKQGKRVLRLKGGDPFIFGRGGEEIATLCDEGIPFQVVPGITAASGCAAYAGIPLTHRDYAQSVIFVTGNMKSGKLDLNWDQLIKPRQTVVVYMGLDGLSELFSQLMRYGMDANMPVALIEQGTTTQQRVITGKVGSLAQKMITMDVHAPTLIIIGDVVRLHASLQWKG